MSFDECSRKAVRRSDGEGGHELAGAGASGRDGVRVLGGGRAAGQRRRASAVLRAGMAVCAADGDAGEPRGRAGEPGDVRLHGHRGAGRRGCRAVPAARGADRPRRPGHARRHPRQYAGRGADAAQAAGARPQPARCAAGTTPQSPPTRCPFNATWRHTTRSMTSSQVTASSSLEAIVAGKPQVTVFASGFS